MAEDASVRVVVVDYWAGNRPGDERYLNVPYRAMMHTEGDVKADWHASWRSMLEEVGAKDGDEVEITIRRTGRRPFGDRRMRLVRDHEYEREASHTE